MVRRNRDAKFIIYQVLYIFVITVLALKGAEINLGEVVDKERVVEKGVRDSLIEIVDSLTDLGINFNIEIDTAIVEENQILRERLTELNSQVAVLTKRVIKTPREKPEQKRSSKTSNLRSPFSKDIAFLQYATNLAENKSNENVTILDPETNLQIVELSPWEKKEFELKNQNLVVINYGDRTDEVKVIKNNPPEILIEKVTTKMDRNEIFVKDLQRTTCFKIYIKDERPEQIKISHSGPINVNGPLKDNKGNIVYTVSLNLAANEDRFERWADDNEHLLDSDDRYKINFFFKAFDMKSKHNIEVGESFYFTEFSN
jgi:hypothetical protein